MVRISARRKKEAQIRREEVVWLEEEGGIGDIRIGRGRIVGRNGLMIMSDG